jgi:transcriptional regulator with XRE-family HTH domain
VPPTPPSDQELPDGGPTVNRILLGTQLRRLREEAGITPQQAGAHIRASHAKISRLELGRVGFKTRDIEDLLTLYGILDATKRESFLAMAQRSNERGWWSRDNDLVQGWFEMYLRLEQEATSIRTFEAQLIPGLLQCERYARAVLQTILPSAPPHEVDRRVQLRMQRQKILSEPGAPKLWAIIDESALTRPVGSATVMKAQLEHLLEMAARRSVTVQVLPFLSGGHAAMGGPFSILRFNQPELPDVVYLEQFNSAAYLDRRAEVEEYLWAMERLVVSALTPAQSRTHMQELLGAS